MEKDLGKIKKNDTADIIVRIDDFGGRKGLTIREFISTDRYTGFTKQGVRILATDFPAFKKMINSISDDDMKESEGENVGNNKPTKEWVGEKAQKQLSEQESLDDY